MSDRYGSVIVDTVLALETGGQRDIVYVYSWLAHISLG